MFFSLLFLFRVPIYINISMFCVVFVVVHAQPGDLVDPDFSYIREGFHDEHIMYTKSKGYMDFNFMPNNKGLLVNEKDGIVRYYSDFLNFESKKGQRTTSRSSCGDDNNNDNDDGPDRKIVLDISDKVCENGERGLHSMTLHPDFQINGYIYLFYTYDKYNNCIGKGAVNRFSRFIYNFDTNEIDPKSEKTLIETGIFIRDLHNGGGAAFGPDGHIYLGVGDGGYMKPNSTASSPSTLLGSILRITDDGDIPDDNPFAQTNGSAKCALSGGESKSFDIPCQEVFATGVRNVFNLVMNPYKDSADDVHFYFNDVGASDFEEINEGGASYSGTFYGWREREGPCKRKFEDGHYYCSDVSDGSNKDPIHWYTHGQDFNITVSRAAVGSTFVPDEANWPETYTSTYLWSDYRLGIFHLKYTGLENRNRTDVPPTSNYDAIPIRLHERVTRMKFGPCYSDSCFSPIALYYLSREYNGILRRLSYVGDDVDHPPVATFSTILEEGGAGLTVSLDASRSYDPHGDNKDLTFTWDYGDKSPLKAISDDITTHQYRSKGTYEVSLTVTDKTGKSSTATETVMLGDRKLNELATFKWHSKEDDPVCAGGGYDYCGVMEFCFVDGGECNGVCGYRVPCGKDDITCDKECKSGPGPVIRMESGKRYSFTLHNTAPVTSASGKINHHSTNIHTHGLHIVGSGDGDDVTRVVSADNCLDYTWDIPVDHPDGTYWYHPHHHGSSETQVRGGAFGLLIIENNKNLHGNSIPDWTYNERLLQISRIDNTVLGNGNSQEPIYIDEQQWYRLRVSIVDPDATAHNLEFGKACDVYKVASDGIWHSVVPSQAEIGRVYELNGSSRGDFAIRCFHDSREKLTITFAGEIAAVIHIRNLKGTPYELTAWRPVLPESLRNIAPAIVSNENKYNVEIGRSKINGLRWDADVPLRQISFDTVNEWNLSDTRDHPFHTHLYHMLIMTPGGCGTYKEGEFYDTIAGPPCTVRFKTADIGQRFVFHCHVLSHGDRGAMGWIGVQGGSGMPTNNANSSQHKCNFVSELSSSQAPSVACKHVKWISICCAVLFCLSALLL